MSYSPTLQRWAQPEPSGPAYVDGMNLYEAFRDNPVNRIDPTGLVTKVEEDGSVKRSGEATIGTPLGNVDVVAILGHFKHDGVPFPDEGATHDAVEFKATIAADCKADTKDFHWIQFVKQDFYRGDTLFTPPVPYNFTQGQNGFKYGEWAVDNNFAADAYYETGGRHSYVGSVAGFLMSRWVQAPQ